MTGQFKAIFFDLDGTLRLPSPSPTDAFLEFAQSLDIVVDEASARNVKLWAHQYWSQYKQIQQDMQRYTGEAFWDYYSQLLLQNIGVTENLPQLGVQVRTFFHTAYLPEVSVAPGARETLESLQQAGYYLGLLSNRKEPLDRAVAELGLNDLFDVTLSAGEIGSWKPDPVVFTHLLNQFEDLDPAQCIYVGDNYFADGDGAYAVGIVPVIFDPENLYQAYRHRCIQRIDQLLTDVLNGHSLPEQR